MGFSALRGIVRDRNYTVHGVPATVEPPGGFSVPATIIWLSPTTEISPEGAVMRRAEAHRALAIRISECPGELKRGTKFTIAEKPGEAAQEFYLDSTERVDSASGEYRVSVVRRP